MPDLPDLSSYEQWWREHVRQPESGPADWFRIQQAADKKRSAEVWIYDRIGRSWFEDGTDAKSFARKLAGLDVDQITLHINSPGGDAFDGVAIYNTLHDHPADVHVVVDGLAASAASYIAQAGKTIKMNKAAQMMIHRASGICIGNAKDMTDFADVLGKLDSSIAGIYHSRAGGQLDDWLAAMTGETWYTAAEAVQAGLADEAVAETPAEPKARASFDLRIFAYAGRDAAPPPKITDRTDPPAPPEPPKKKGAGMDPAKLREAFGLAADASDDEVSAAITAENLVPPAAAPPGNQGDPPAGDPPPAGGPPPAPPRKPRADEGGAVYVDPAQLAELRRMAAQGEEALRRMKEQECSAVLDAAIKAGKFPPSRREHYEKRWASDPDGTKEEINALQAGVIPVSLLGFPGVTDDTAEEMLYKSMGYGAVSTNG